VFILSPCHPPTSKMPVKLLLRYLEGRKTYLAAIGYCLLGASQALNSQVESSYQSFLTAFGLFGLRQALARNAPTPTPTPTDPQSSGVSHP